jgi:hypothetical protein
MDRSNFKDNVIRAKVTEQTFRKVLAIAHKYDTTMSDVVRLCVDASLDKVDEVLRKYKEEREKLKPAL